MTAPTETLPPATPQLLTTEWMTAFLKKFCRPRSLTWSCPKPSEQEKA